MRLRVTVLAVIAILVAGCEVGGRADAMALATSFMTALEQRDTERAWSLMYGPKRSRVFEDHSKFDALVRNVDLAGTTWEATDARVHDGHYHVTLQLEPLRVDDALGVFVEIVETDGRPTHASMQVDIEPLLGERGVLGG
jgi:hypothetical protein